MIGTKNFHVLRIVYLPQTQKLLGRFKICSDRFKQSIVIDIDTIGDEYPQCSAIMGIAHILEKQGYNVLGMGNGNGCNYLITDTFEPLKPL
jgi:hypothetical protein